MKTKDVPFTTLRRNPNAILKQLETISSNSTTSNTHLNGHSVSSSQPIQVEVLCRRGNDSREAVKLLSEANASNQSSADNHQQSKIKFEFVNVRGGLRAFSKNVDSEFPIYWTLLEAWLRSGRVFDLWCAVLHSNHVSLRCRCFISTVKNVWLSSKETILPSEQEFLLTTAIITAITTRTETVVM